MLVEVKYVCVYFLIILVSIGIGGLILYLGYKFA